MNMYVSTICINPVCNDKIFNSLARAVTCIDLVRLKYVIKLKLVLFNFESTGTLISCWENAS